MKNQPQGVISTLLDRTLSYLVEVQVARAGPFFGAFWSDKAYHGPLLDYHAGGSHHNRTAGSAGWALWQAGTERRDDRLRHQAEFAFDWVMTRQTDRGGFLEIQNNDQPADWERTGLSECSTISTAFVVHGLAHALLGGLAPKPTYESGLQRAALWQLSIEWPPGSGVFPHHERSPYDTLNANLHAAETFFAGYTALKLVYGRPLNLLLMAARRAIDHTIALQWSDGSFPYRATHGVTLNYTAVVAWCLLNIRDLSRRLSETHEQWVSEKLDPCLERAADFLVRGIDPAEGRLRWEALETSSARHNTWVYAISLDVLRRVNTAPASLAAARLARFIPSLVHDDGLLGMRDGGEPITRCAYMQADIFNFLWPHREALDRLADGPDPRIPSPISEAL